MTLNSKSHTSNWVFLLLRLFLGLVFLFSSFVKGVDPIGTAYKVEDYLMAFGWNFFIRYALVISYGVILLEFLMGITLMSKAFLKQALWVTLLTMVFFTGLTYMDATKNMVSDCGCFGDAVKLSNWETFYKNIVLLIVVIVLIIGQYKFRFHGLRAGKSALSLFFAAVVFVSFMSYNLNHLPVIDFRPWKVGQEFYSQKENKPKVYVSYKNKKTGEVKEYLFPNYPWRDSTWMKQWVFVGQRTIVDNYQSPSLFIQDSLGADGFDDVFVAKGFHLVVVSFDIRLSETEGFKKLASLMPLLQKEDVSVVLLTSSDRSVTKEMLSNYGINIPVYFADEVTLKAIIRSNPGLILLHNGILQNKWAVADFPSEKQIKKMLEK
ncbi:MAG: hypothetical protein JXR65_12630 [Bacteroidales bacterium]|nr:hypothetical protein [Bacteroidales bacterium]